LNCSSRNREHREKSPNGQEAATPTGDRPASERARGPGGPEVAPTGTPFPPCRGLDT
jgi:hypothetical protein